MKTKNDPLKKGILDGIRVLDFSRMLSGPYATMLLADHGAEVIKIEGAEGDSSRRSGPFKDNDKKKEWSGYFISLNRNKKSICLNLKKKDDVDFLKKLIEEVDVLVENFRPGVMERLGLSFDDVSKINPRIVYGSINGFGSNIFGESPYQNWPSYDVVAQAMGGLISLTGHDENTPLKVGPGIADIFSGSLLSFGLLASILKSRVTGKGQLVEVAMYDAIVSMCERAIYQYDFNGVIPKPEGNGHPLLAPFGIYKASDGFVAIGIVENSYWNVLKKIINLADLNDDLKYGTIALRAKNRKKLNKQINTWTNGFSKKELAELLGGQIPFGPVNNVKEVFEDQHIRNRNMILEIEQPFYKGKDWKVAGNPIKFKDFKSLNLMPPILGEHKNVYACSLKSNVVSQTNKLFQPQKNAYRCIVTFTTKDNQAFQFYSNSFTWLNSKETYLICGLSKSKVKPLKNLMKSVTFYFSKLRPGGKEHEEDINFLNLKLSNRNISDVSLINTESEMLISAKA
ncbi:CoA transferase [Paracoccaceae bacterium]|nr:CoA transferase [Paracoccaceae bacterium]